MSDILFEVVSLLLLIFDQPACTTVYSQCLMLPRDPLPAYDAPTTSVTHSPVSIGWRPRNVFSSSWRQSSIVLWTVRLLTTWLQICAVCLTCRPDVCGHHLLISAMSASRSVQVQLLKTDRSLWLVLDYGTVCYLILFDTLSWFHREKQFCLDSHISLFCFSFYCAMHFSAKRGIVIACRLSVRPSVCLSVCPSVTLVDCDHIGWNSSKLILPLVSLGCSLFANPTWRVWSKGKTHKFGPKVTHPLVIWASETFDRKLRPNGYR